MFFLIFPFHEELLSLFKANPIRNCSLRNVFSLSEIFSVSLFFSKCLSCLLCVPMSLHFLSFSSFCVSVICFSLATSLCFYICLYPPLLLSVGLSFSLSLHIYIYTYHSFFPHPTSNIQHFLSDRYTFSCLLKIYYFLYPSGCKHLTPKSSPLQDNFTEEKFT